MELFRDRPGGSAHGARTVESMEKSLQAELPDSEIQEIREERQYLVFETSHGTYGINILNTSEILKPVFITRLPNVEAEILGMINLRGNILPVLDLNKKLKDIYTEVTRLTRIIVTSNDGKFLGLLADRIVGVAKIFVADIEGTELGNLSGEYLEGVGRGEQGVFLILNPSRLLARETGDVS